MKLSKSIALVLIILGVGGILFAQQPGTGTIKGKVRVDSGSASGVTVTAGQGDKNVSQVETNRKGDFSFNNLQPGIYSLTFRKPGLALGKLENVEVKAGKVNELGGGLKMHVDEGSIAFIEGSVFSPEGRIVPGARVDIVKLGADGSAKKVNSDISNGDGMFSFRLSPALATYRVTAKVGGAEPVSKEVKVDGASVYRIALNIIPTQK